MILHATHSHLYPGLEGRISGLSRLEELRTKRECLIEFSDGSAAAATLVRSHDEWQLDSVAYRTAAGTDIGAKHWRLHIDQESGQASFRIIGKART